MCAAESWSEHTQRLSALFVGDCVRIQNQTGPQPNKCDNTASVVEVRQFDQYVGRVDGSGRMTLRNRNFPSKYVPVIPRPPRHTIDEDLLICNLAIGPHMPLHATSGGGGYDSGWQHCADYANHTTIGRRGQTERTDIGCDTCHGYTKR